MTRPRFPTILVTGGAGYVGTLLAPQLLARGHAVRVYDTMYYGCLLAEQPGLTLIRGDIRDTANLAAAFAGVDAVIHLACISNDAGFELDEKLSQSINYDCFEPMVVAAKRAGVKRFIYASSSSVYGVSDKPDVTEDHPLLPLTLYNKFKGLCEPLLFRHQSPDFTCVTIRPATVCGYSPRQRLDLSVNILTNQAVNAGRITVFGGAQLRPNLHIQDMCDLYKLLLDVDDGPIAGETFNAGYQNMSIADIARAVVDVVAAEFPGRKPVEVVTTPTNDPRSYHINSDKIARKLGFRARHSVEDAVRDLCRAFRADATRGAILDPAGGTSVKVVALDEVMRGGKAGVVKLNIEGAEIDALHGAVGTLRRHRPMLILSLYHRPSDLWRIPETLDALAPGYTFYLRQHDGGTIETVLYALPGRG